MTLLSPSADFVYGNTRLRARKGELLGEREYEALLGRDLEGILEALAGTAYRAEIEAVLAVTGANRRALHEALSRHLARALGELRAFYEGRARELVDLLLSRFDLHNLLALLRGRVRGQPAEQVLANVFPLGALGGAAAQEIARQPEPRTGGRPARRLAAARSRPRPRAGRRLAGVRAHRGTRGARARPDDAPCAPCRAGPGRCGSGRRAAARARRARARRNQRADRASPPLRPPAGRAHRVAGAPRCRPLPRRRDDRAGGARDGTAAADAGRGCREAHRSRAARGLARPAPAHRRRRRPPDSAARARGEPCALGGRSLPARRPARPSTFRSRTRSRRRTRCGTCGCSARARQEVCRRPRSVRS